MSPLDLDDADSLRRAYAVEGRSLSAIAELAGCSYASVRRALLANGIEIRRSGPAPIEDLRDRAWLQARAQEGLSAKDIAELLDCAEGTVRSALQWAGVAAAAPRVRPSALDDAAFLQREYVVESRSVRSIAQEIGCTKDAVLVALRSHGIPIRKRGRSTRPAAAPTATEQLLPASGDGASAGEDPEPFEAAGGAVAYEPLLEPEPTSLRMALEHTYSKVRGEPFPEPLWVPAQEPIPGREPDIGVETPLQTEPPPASEVEQEPDAFELELPPVHPERSTSAGATLASFPQPSSESVPEPPPVVPGPAPHDTGAHGMTTTTPAAATQVEPPPASASSAAPPPVMTLPARIDLEIDKIETKTFPVARRGYDRQQVDDFLRSVAKDYRQVVKSARDAVNAARVAAQTAPAPPAPVSSAPAQKSAAHAFEDIGGRVTAVLTSAAEAAEEIRASAEKEALAIRQRAREETEELRQEAAEALAEANQVRVATEQEAMEAEATAREEAEAIVAAARQRVTQLEEEARERIATRDRTIRANIDAAIAEARRDYEHLRSAQQQCIDRLASVEFLAKHARDGLSENVGQSIEELL